MPINPIGRKAEWKVHHNHCYEAAQTRFVKNGFRCFGCGERPSRTAQWAHIFGRRQIVGEPYASELTEMLCGPDPFKDTIGCHKTFDMSLNKPMVERVREAVARRWYGDHGARYPTNLNPIGAVIRLASKLDKQGKPLPPSQKKHAWKFSTQGDDPLQRPLYDRGTR